jgi:hypothetical protein
LKLRLFKTPSPVTILSKEQPSPVQNQWYDLTHIFTIPSDGAGNTNIQFFSEYENTATANGKVLEVKEVIALDLTAIFGAGKEPTVEQMDAFIAKTGWFNSWNNDIPSSGSNANGSWVRYADGTQICYNSVTAVYSGTSRLEVQYTHPISFISIPIASATRLAASLARVERGIAAITPSTAGGTIRLFATSGDAFISTDTAAIQYMAIGRWK